MRIIVHAFTSHVHSRIPWIVLTLFYLLLKPVCLVSLLSHFNLITLIHVTWAIILPLSIDSYGRIDYLFNIIRLKSIDSTNKSMCVNHHPTRPPNRHNFHLHRLVQKSVHKTSIKHRHFIRNVNNRSLRTYNKSRAKRRHFIRNVNNRSLESHNKSHKPEKHVLQLQDHAKRMWTWWHRCKIEGHIIKYHHQIPSSSYFNINTCDKETQWHVTSKGGRQTRIVLLLHNNIFLEHFLIIIFTPCSKRM